MKKSISIVTPVYNEEGNVVELCERVAAVMADLPYNYEHLCIDNCSTDGTTSLLRQLAAEDPKLKVIINVRNFGHIRSPFHGLLQAKGDAAVLIAGDLQDPPEMIKEFLDKWEAGFKTVMATKSNSEESPVMFAIRKAYYKFIGSISEVSLIPNATGCGLFDRAVITVLRDLKDPYPYFRGLVCEIGYPIATVPFRQPKRTRGISSNNFYTLYDIALLGLTKHSKVPLRVMTLSGFFLAGSSTLVGLAYFLAKLLFWDHFEMGMAPMLIGFFFLTSVQMVSLGILGEYIGSIQTHVRNFPHVVEAERINF